MKKNLLVVSALAFGLVGCAKMPIEKYDGFAQEWAFSAKCAEVGHVSPYAYSTMQEGWYWAANRWGKYDNAKMYSMSVEHHMRMPDPSFTHCQDMLSMAKYRLQKKADDKAKSDATWADIAEQNARKTTTQCLSQTMGNSGVLTTCN